MYVPRYKKKIIIKDSFLWRNRATVWSRPSLTQATRLCDFNAKVGSEDIFQPTIGKESEHPESNEYGIRLVNFA